MNFEIDANFTIYSFTLTIVRDSKLLLMKNLFHPTGARFSDDPEAEQAMKALNAGDKLLLSEILCHGPDGNERHLQPIEFLITDKEE
jgi:hypothetical protein